MNEVDDPYPPSAIPFMWCSHCQQDVPAVASRDGTSALRCVRCETLLAGTLSSSTGSSSTGSPASPPVPEGIAPLATLPEQATIEQLLQPPLPQDDWQLEAELRYVERLAQAWRNAPPSEPLPLPGESAAMQRAEKSHAQNEQAHDSISNKQPKPRFANLAWTSLSLGVMTFVCGGVLLAWSAIAHRTDLWSIGLPLTLFGQAGLILGLVLQLETLWQTNRATSQTLESLDGEINELRHSTTLLTQSRSSPSQSFYLHLSEGASPHLLLADLKGQLDLLSEQMSKRR
jgi:hypothetical protein